MSDKSNYSVLKKKNKKKNEKILTSRHYFTINDVINLNIATTKTSAKQIS